MPSNIVAISFDGKDFSVHQAQLACALNLCQEFSDESRSTILGTFVGGPGASSIPCHALVCEIEESRPDIFAAVANNATQWEQEARREYRRWFEAISQIVQRLSARGQILPYLEPPDTNPGRR